MLIVISIFGKSITLTNMAIYEHFYGEGSHLTQLFLASFQMMRFTTSHNYEILFYNFASSLYSLNAHAAQIYLASPFPDSSGGFFGSGLFYGTILASFTPTGGV